MNVVACVSFSIHSGRFPGLSRTQSIGYPLFELRARLKKIVLCNPQAMKRWWGLKTATMSIHGSTSKQKVFS